MSNKAITNKIKKICCIGAGYVGGPTMAVIAAHCSDIEVSVVDINEEKIKGWNNSNLDLLPVFEPGLKEVISRCRNKNLFFTTNIPNSIEEADMVFISVNTPTKEKGLGAGYASDLKWVESSAREVAKYAEGHTIVVEKSTVPVRTSELIKEILKSSSKGNKGSRSKSFAVLSSPEFLAEGTAIDDLENPDRVLIGGDDIDAIEILSKIYQRWIPRSKILLTNVWSSELTKLTANAFLAQRVTSINSIAALCEPTGAHVTEVAEAIGFDSRIGRKFLSPSPGFGGSCFQKDLLNLVYLSKYYGLDEVADYWEQVIKLNNWQKKRISTIIVEKLFGTVSLKKILILGFAFKSNTNDTRESSAILISKELIENGAKLFIHDPQVNPHQIQMELGTKPINGDNYQEGSWSYSEDLYASALDADAIVILTEWEIYKDLDWLRLFQIMRRPSWVFDTRSIVKKEQVQSIGFHFWALGRGIEE
jgi:UDPglucose 6-dehydrogenase